MGLPLSPKSSASTSLIAAPMARNPLRRRHTHFGAGKET